MYPSIKDIMNYIDFVILITIGALLKIMAILLNRSPNIKTAHH